MAEIIFIAGSSVGSSLDRFGPSVVVGNTIAGDSAVAYSQDGFNYVPDTGNGAGIAIALGLVASGGWVHIRRGTYNFNSAGGPAGPLTVPAGVSISGEGRLATTIVGLSVGDQGVFTTTGFTSIVNLSVGVSAADPAGVGSAAIITSAGRTHIENVNVSILASATGTLRDGIRHTGASTITLLDTSFVGTASKLGAGSPTSAIRISGGATLYATSVSAAGFDIGINADRSICELNNITITDFDLRAIWRTNSTFSSTGAGSLNLTNFRFVADATGGANVIDATWGAVRISNGSISTSGATAINAGIRFSEPSENYPDGLQITNVSVENAVWGMLLEYVGGVQITNLSVTPTTTGGVAAGGVRVFSSGDVSIDSLRVGFVRGAGYGVDIDTSSDVRIDNGSIKVFGTAGAYGIRFRGVGDSHVHGMLIYTYANGGNPIVIEQPGTSVQGCRIVSTDNSAVAQIRVVNTTNALVSNNILTASSRNFGKIYLEGSSSCVVNGNNVQSAVGQPGIVLDATSTFNQVNGNYCQGSTNGGVNPPVTDLGTDNNVGQNYGS